MNDMPGIELFCSAPTGRDWPLLTYSWAFGPGYHIMGFQPTQGDDEEADQNTTRETEETENSGHRFVEGLPFALLDILHFRH